MVQLRSSHHFFLFIFCLAIVLLIGYRTPRVWNRFHYRPTKFLSRRLDERLHLLQQNFNHVNISMLLGDQLKSSNQTATLTYRCRQWCGGCKYSVIDHFDENFNLLFRGRSSSWYHINFYSCCSFTTTISH